MRKWVRLALALAVACGLCACGGGGAAAIPIADWTLETANGTSPVTLPAHLDARLPPGPCRYVLRARVDLPAAMRGRPLTLALAHLPALATLRVGDHEAVALDTSPLDRYRTNGAHRWRIQESDTQRDALDLAIAVEHAWTLSAWVDWVPVLSDTPAGDAKFLAVTSFNQAAAFAALTTMLLVSFVYSVVYLADRRRTVHLWHALQGFFGAAYPAVLLGVLEPAFGTGDVAVSAMGIAASAICSVYFVAGMFELPTPPRAWWLLLVLAAIASLASSGPFETARWVVPVSIVSVLAASVYGVRVYVRARRDRTIPLGGAFAALAFPSTLLLGIPDASSLLGLGDLGHGLRGGPLAITALSILQAIALGRSHTESVQRSEHLNAELQARVRLLEAGNAEIRSLNDELRRQITARSRHLAEALSRLGPLFARPRDFVPGDVIDERYRVVRRIGEGGMGSVYEVERLLDGRRFALKILQGQRSGADLARLAREAEMASHVDHPNVVSMVDVDVSASGAVFVVMEYVGGASLDDLTARYGDVPWALGLLRQIADGLAIMHAQDIVHRDLKPGNVLVTRATSGEDLAKIADFGIAMRSGASDETAAPSDATQEDPDIGEARTDPALTRTGQVLGTPLYMAPELARGAKNASAASDVYALGVMAYELLTGEPPTGHEALAHLRRGSLPPPALAALAPSLDRHRYLVVLLERCLARDPAVRPTARALADALATAIADGSTEAARGIPAA